MPQTLTRADIADRFYEEVGLSRNESAALVEQVIDEMVDGLVRDDVLKISGFASLYVKEKNQRVGRNPKTGEEVVIEPRKVISFKASNTLKESIAKGEQGKK